MTTDRYTKIVLTVIAAALTWIAGQQLLSGAAADSTCGIQTPCMVVNVYRDSSSMSWEPCYKGGRACYAVATSK